MSLTSTTLRVSHNGNGTQTTFPFTYKIFAEGDLVVTLIQSGGAEVNLTLGVDYTVEAAFSDFSSGGNVITKGTYSPPASGETLVIYREMDLTQETDLSEGGPLPAETVESEFDKSRMIDQQLDEKITRQLIAPLVDPTLDLTIPNYTARANKLLGFDAAGLPIAADGSSTVVSAWAATFVDDTTAAAARTTLDVYSKAEVDAFITAIETFYRAFTVETGESITKGDIVELLDTGKIRRWRNPDNLKSLFKPEEFACTYDHTYARIVKFNRRKAYGSAEARQVEFIGLDPHIQYGDIVALTGSTNQRTFVFPTTDELLAMAYWDDTAAAYAAVITKDRLELTKNSDASYGGSFPQFGGAYRLSDTQIVVAGQNSTTSLRARSATRTGTSMAWDTEDFETTTVYYCVCTLLDENTLLATWWDAGTNGNFKGVLIDISGATVTIGTPATIWATQGQTGNACFGYGVIRVDDTHAIAVFRCNHASYGPMTLVPISTGGGTPAGGTVLTPTWTSFGTDGSGLDNLQIWKLAVDRYLLFAREATGSDNYISLVKSDPSTYALTELDGDNDFIDTDVTQLSVVDERRIAGFTASEGRLYKMGPEVDRILGVANETKSAGESCQVVLPGGKYTETAKFAAGRGVGINYHGNLATDWNTEIHRDAESDIGDRWCNLIGFGLDANNMLVKPELVL